MRPNGDELDEVVDEFLGERPRASRLSELRAAMERRVEGLKESLERAADDDERAGIQKELRTAERHLEALAQEELITEFVEGSVRATASWSLLRPEDEEE